MYSHAQEQLNSYPIRMIYIFCDFLWGFGIKSNRNHCFCCNKVLVSFLLVWLFYHPKHVNLCFLIGQNVHSAPKRKPPDGLGRGLETRMPPPNQLTSGCYFLLNNFASRAFVGQPTIKLRCVCFLHFFLKPPCFCQLQFISLTNDGELLVWVPVVWIPGIP